MLKFDPKIFLGQLAEELVQRFSNANRASTPGLIGAVRENEIRQKLESILPSIAGVGTGCVIDSYGAVSKQTDIIIYEKNLCPVFSFADGSGAAFFPCESVIACGEIKSVLDRTSLEDSFEKAASVKSLRRHSDDPAIYRTYGSTSGLHGTYAERLRPEVNHLDQIFYFILGGKFGLKMDAALSCCEGLSTKYGVPNRPNMLFSLNDGVIAYLKKDPRHIMLSAHDSDSICHCTPEDGSFQFLLSCIHDSISRGRTSRQLPFEKYVSTGQRMMQIHSQMLVGATQQLPEQ